MKKILLTMPILCLCITVFAQTNTFPTSGNTGIGTTSPTAKLHVAGEIRAGDNSAYTDVSLTTGTPHGIYNQVNVLKPVTVPGSGVARTALHLQSNISTGSNIMDLLVDGNIGVGTISPTERLAVNGKILAKEIKVSTTGWPDYVFKPDYQLLSLPALEKYIKTKGHLPEIPPAEIAEKDGVDLGNMNKLLLKKIEELTLLLIQQNKRLEILEGKSKK